MISAVDHGKISPEQYSRPYSSALAHGINLRLVFDWQLYLQQPFSLACSDLKSCCLRIFHSAASLALQRLCIPLPIIISMLDIIQSMTHMFRTSYGDSNLTYGGDTIPEDFRHFMMVLCQGNGSASQIWSVISSVVFSALRSQSVGIYFSNSFATEISRLVRFSYVGYCDMVQSYGDIEATHSQIQLAVSKWRDLIRITGGCLAPDKSAWYPVYYKCRIG